MIQIGKRGQIMQGDWAGWYILIQDDTEETGGYYVLFAKEPCLEGGPGEGYDDWVESKDCLPLLFAKHDWEVRWEQ